MSFNLDDLPLYTKSDGPGLSKNSISAIHITNISGTTITGATITELTGATHTLQLYVLNQDDYYILTGSAGTTYTSATPAKATVDANGLITGVASGTSIITITYKDASWPKDWSTLTTTFTITVS